MSKNNNLDKEVHHLVELLNRHELTELEVEHKGFRIRVRRGGGAADAVQTVAAEPNRQAGSTPGGLAGTAAEATVPNTLVTVTSPIVGTFYRSASPDADAYVDEGDMVKKGQVLCIVEAMKLMNEIESEVDGRVHKILTESAKPVEYGQPLFLIDPTASP
ncbi:MAG TPA: acetyl-CoA carboxylase biotin carboxyl carrier protein [Nitrospiraceae bacterium]|jgi:acetyl-CoA carboxylase biotin carboxyl carrier protein